MAVDERATAFEDRQRGQHDFGGRGGDVVMRGEDDAAHLGERRGGQAEHRGVFAHDEEGLHLAGVDVSREGLQVGDGRAVGETGDEGAAEIRGAVFGDQEAVALAHVGRDVDRSVLRLGETREQALLFDGHVGRAHDRERAGGEGFGSGGEGRFDRGLLVLHRRVRHAVRGVDGLEKFAAGVGHPRVVHGVVLARRDAVDLAFAGPDGRVRAGGGFGVDARGLLQEPDAHLETEVGARERADGADVDRVERVIVIQFAAREAGQRVVGTAVDEAQDRVLGDLAGEAHAARAEDAAFVVERDARPEAGLLRLGVLLVDVARITAAVFGGELLQLALAGLVADRAVERVVEEKHLRHAFAAGFDAGRFETDVQAGRDVGGAGDGRLRLPADLRLAVFHHQLVGRAVAHRRAELDQAHAAVAGDRELRVIAIVGDFLPDFAQGIDQVGPGRDLMFDAIDIDGDQRRFVVRDHGSGKMTAS